MIKGYFPHFAFIIFLSLLNLQNPCYIQENFKKYHVSDNATKFLSIFIYFPYDYRCNIWSSLICPLADASGIYITITVPQPILSDEPYKKHKI